MAKPRFRKFTVVHAGQLRVSSKNAFTVILKKDQWTPIPESYWRAMYAAGAISEDMVATDAKDITDVIDQATARRRAIKEEMKRIITEDDRQYLSQTGRPILSHLNKVMGFTEEQKITANERDDLWAETKMETRK